MRQSVKNLLFKLSKLIPWYKINYFIPLNYFLILYDHMRMYIYDYYGIILLNYKEIIDSYRLKKHLENDIPLSDEDKIFKLQNSVYFE